MKRTPRPAATGSPEQEQREARMLVSDLLEIGVQQRKAYQDAKQKAAAAPVPGTNAKAVTLRLSSAALLSKLKAAVDPEYAMNAGSLTFEARR